MHKPRPAQALVFMEEVKMIYNTTCCFFIKLLVAKGHFCKRW